MSRPVVIHKVTKHESMSKACSCGVCCSYAEVRAEQRRELGIQESNPEATADKVRVPAACVCALFILSRVNELVQWKDKLTESHGFNSII